MNTNCSDIHNLLIDYIDGQLAPAVRDKVEQHLRTCPACSEEVAQYKKLFSEMSATQLEQPSPALKENFKTMLQSELNIAATMEMLKTRQEAPVVKMKAPAILLRVAACLVLVAIGAFGALQFSKPAVEVTAQEVKELKTEMQQVKEAMLLTMLSGQSASDRIRAASSAEELSNPDQRIIQALLHTMNADENVNVRLAAVNSIAKFSANNPKVVDSLVASLSQQTEPLVQIVLITILTDKKETKAIAPIREIISNKQTLAPVKQVAEQGLKKVI
jgi:HEAT repeat protein